MRTQIGIVYDRVTGELRRIIIPDEDFQLVAHSDVSFGEAFHMETFLGDITVDGAKAIIQRVTGKMPTDTARFVMSSPQSARKSQQ